MPNFTVREPCQIAALRERARPPYPSCLRNGTQYEERGDRIVEILDRNGRSWADLEWTGDRLAHLDVFGASVRGMVIDDPLLGPAHPIVTTTGSTAMTTIDWLRPTEIPAIANPALLPLGAGSAILDVVARLAKRAGVTALRYAGPYPTNALWRALLRSFRTTGSEAEFTANALDRMLARTRTPIPIDFTPAPHDRVEVPRGHVELRDGLERAVIDGIAYEPDGSPARLVENRAEVWFGDARYAHVATFADDGSIVEGPHTIPPLESDIIGATFPAALVAAIAELVADAVPEPLARDARRWLGTRDIRWADLGGRAAAVTEAGVDVHAALFIHVAPVGLGRLALALAEALVPLVTRGVVTEVMSATAGDR